MRKILTILVFIMLLSVPAVTEAADFEFSSTDYAVTGYIGAGGDVTVPDVLDGCPVEIIESGVFYGNNDVTSLALPETLLTLGSSNLYFMEGLTDVQLPTSLEIIDEYNFYSCPAIESVVIPARVTYIGSYSFNGCENLAEITFLGDVPAMGLNCFQYLPDYAVVYVPDDKIGAYQAALPDVIVAASGKNAVTCDYTADETMFEFDAATGEITSYLGFATRVDIPSEIGGVPVTAIGPEAFYGCRYTYYVTIPEGVTGIGEYAFADTYCLSHVELPESLITIGDGAFNFFRGAVVEIPANVESIGEKAFNMGQLEEVYFDGDVSYIGPNAFAGNYISYLCFAGCELPETDVTAFADMDIADVDISHTATKAQMESAQAFFDGLGMSTRVWRMQNPNVDYITDYQDVYAEGVLTAYTGTQSHLRPWDSYDGYDVTALGEGVFADNPYIIYFSVPYNDLFTTIGDYAFARSGVEYVDLFDSVTTIGEGAFEDCWGLTEITIPESVTYIGAGAFRNCVSLQRVVVLCDPAVLPEGAFEGCISLSAVYGPADADDARLEAISAAADLPWYAPAVRLGETPAELIRMPYEELPLADFWYDEEYARIDDYMGCEVNLYLPREIDDGKLTMVSGNVLNRARDYGDGMVELPVRSLVIPENYTEITDYAFSDCTTLETVICYAPIEYLPEGAFSGCTALREVVFVNGVGGINEYAFMDCYALETLYVGEKAELPEGLWDSYGGDAFDVSACIVDPMLMPDVGMLLEAVKSEPIAAEDFEDEPEYDDFQLTPEPVGAEGEPFIGAWKVCSITDGVNEYAEAFGINIELQLNEDGTLISYDANFGECELGVWFVIDGMAFVGDMAFEEVGDGRLCYTEDGMSMYMERIPALSADPAIIPDASELFGEAPAEESIEEPVDEPAAGGEDLTSRMEAKYVCTVFSAGGVEQDAALLNAEYSLIFHESGKVDYVMGGVLMDGATWGLQEVAIGLETYDAFVIDYYGMEFVAVITETGFEIDYYGVIYIYEPEE